MYKTLSILTLCCFITIKLSAQSRRESFSVSSHYVSETMDIVWKKPRRFIWENTGIPLGAQGNRDLGTIYEGTMRSRNGNYFILYPNMRVLAATLYNQKYSGEQTIARRQMMKDIKDALSGQDNTPLAAIDLEKYVTTFVGNDAPFNADTVFLVQIPLKKPYQNKYLYCTGIYIWKKDRVPMIFKCFFTEKEKKNEKKILAKFYKLVRYKNDNYDWYLQVKKERRKRDKEFIKALKDKK